MSSEATKESKLNPVAKTWTPNASAKAFVPGGVAPSTNTPSPTPTVNNSSNSQKQHNNQTAQQHQRMNSSAPVWAPNAAPQMQVKFTSRTFIFTEIVFSL